MTNYKVGDLVKVISSGRIVRLDDVNQNPNYIADDEYWGSGWDSSRGTVIFDSPEQIIPSSAQLPSREDVTDFVANMIHGGFGRPFEVDETEVDGFRVYATGVTDEGLEFEFVISIGSVGERSL